MRLRLLYCVLNNEIERMLYHFKGFFCSDCNMIVVNAVNLIRLTIVVLSRFKSLQCKE